MLLTSTIMRMMEVSPRLEKQNEKFTTYKENQDTLRYIESTSAYGLTNLYQFNAAQLLLQKLKIVTSPVYGDFC